METTDIFDDNNEVQKKGDIELERDNYKNKSNKIIQSDGEIFEIYGLIESTLESEEKKDFIDLIDICESMNNENKYKVLYYLIENGIYFAPLYSEVLNLDLSKIHMNLFIEGIKNGGDNLFFNENNDAFIDMYKDSNNLKKQLGIEGFFEQYDYFLYENNDLKKIKRDDTLLAIKNYKNNRFTGDTLDKLNSYGLYDWETIIENIFEDYNYAKKIFFELFKLNKKERQDLANLKVDQLNYDFYDEKERIIDEVEDTGMNLISSFSFNNNSTNNTNDFINELNKIYVLKNHANEFHITFFDVTGRINHLELTSSINKLIELSITYENINDFNEKIRDIFNSYQDFLKMNDFNFDILIFKSNGINDSNDNQGINNTYYEGKQLKIA